MRQILMLLLICLTMSTTVVLAQNKKVALLEPRVGEGSSAISGLEKAMIRGELRKAIVNHTGYEAFTRTDVDQMMQEQGFQRTGMVEDSQVKRLGEMCGADYICVSTLNKSNSEFYIEAYLINVETAAISNPASQFGELVDGKLSNMLPVCQALAQELLGTYSPIVNQKTSVNQKQESAQVSSKKQAQQEEQAQPVRQSSPQNETTVGSLYTFSDGTKGIVFFCNSDGHGLVVSLDEDIMQWDSHTKNRQVVDITSIPNVDDIGEYMVMGKGKEYTEAILSQNAGFCPAATWCAKHGAGWYLPSGEEMGYLLRDANNTARKHGEISRALLKHGGVPLDGSWYWCSSENEKSEAFNISSSGRSSSEEKITPLPVRAIRSF